ncbi:MAG: type VI secretion system tube protein Hcp [Pseudonocardiaceae bacterium]
MRLTQRIRYSAIGVAGAIVAVAAVGGADPSSDPAFAAAPTVSLAQLQRAAFTGNATIEMAVRTTSEGDIKGENSDGSIAVSTLRWGVQNPIQPKTNSGIPSTDKLDFDPIVITKDVDAATTRLLEATAAGTRQASVVIYIKPRNSKESIRDRWPLRLTLNSARITSVEEKAGAPAPAATETITMFAPLITFNYQTSSDKTAQFKWGLPDQ